MMIGPTFSCVQTAIRRELGTVSLLMEVVRTCGFDWDFPSAGKEFRRAIELNPGYATAHHWYAWHLSLLGRYDEAIAEARKRKTWIRCLSSSIPTWRSFCSLCIRMMNQYSRAAGRSRWILILLLPTINWSRHTSKNRCTGKQS